MADAVLIRSTLRKWDLILVCAVGVVLLGGAGTAALAGQDVVAGVAAGSGLLLVLAGAAGLSYRIRRRRWLRDRGDGFVVSDHGGDWEVRDEQILSLALLYKWHYSEGELKAVTRCLLVWIASDAELPARMEMVTRFAADAVDPLQGLITRLGNRLVEQARRDLHAGQSALGECWSLEHRELTIREKKDTKSCQLADVTASERVGKHLCIWRQGMDHAWAQVPLVSANLYVLEQLLAEHLAQRPAPAAPAEGLGRILFERRPNRGWAVLLFVVALLFAGAAVVAALAAPQPEIKLLLGLGLAALAILCGLLGLHVLRAVFRCHEHGVYQAGLRGGRSLRDEEVEAFRYSAVRQYYHGAYLGTQFQLELHPLPEVPVKPICYSTQLQHLDADLENLRDRLARRIAARMARQFAAGEPVPWTPRLRFLPHGIEQTRRSLFGGKPPRVIPYTDVAGYKLENGRFYLWVTGKNKPALSEAIAKRNFFPGYFLLATVLQGAANRAVREVHVNKASGGREPPVAE